MAHDDGDTASRGIHCMVEVIREGVVAPILLVAELEPNRIRGCGRDARAVHEAEREIEGGKTQGMA